MPEIEIRPVKGADLLDTIRLRAYAFSSSPPLPGPEAIKDPDESAEDDLQLTLFEDGEAVATAASSPLTVQVRGEILQAGGVWGVATHPGARRNGYVRQLMTRLCAALHEDGVPLSVLYPFRQSFYERLGYTTFPQLHALTFSASALLPLLKLKLAGKVERVLFSEGGEVYRTFLRECQQQIHGMALFNDRTAGVRSRHDRDWLAIARVDGKPVGMMTYRIIEQESKIAVRSLFYHTSHGKYLLLEWLARHADQVENIDLRLAPAEHPETWVPDLYGTLRGRTPAMGRVIDLSALAGIEVGTGEVAVRVEDAVCPWNTGTYQLGSVDGRLQIAAGGQPATTLTSQGVSALIYGTHDPEDFAMRGWGDPSPEVVTRLRTLFPPRLPYLHEEF